MNFCCLESSRLTVSLHIVRLLAFLFYLFMFIFCSWTGFTRIHVCYWCIAFLTHFLTFSARSAEQKLEMEVQPSQNPLKQTNLLFCRTSRWCNHNRVSAQMMELQHGKAKRSLLELSIHDWLIATTPRFVWRFFK